MPRRPTILFMIACKHCGEQFISEGETDLRSRLWRHNLMVHERMDESLTAMIPRVDQLNPNALPPARTAAQFTLF